MIRTVVVLLAIVAVIGAWQAFLSDEPGDPARPVDYRAALTAARADAPYAVLGPVELPAGWRATSVRYEPGEGSAWHLGVLTDEDEYVGLEQATGPPGELLDQVAPETAPAGTVEIDGDTWRLRRSDDGTETTLVREETGATTVVTGTPELSVLEDFVLLLTDSAAG